MKLHLKVLHTYNSTSHKELLKFHTWNKNNKLVFRPSLLIKTHFSLIDHQNFMNKQ